MGQTGPHNRLGVKLEKGQPLGSVNILLSAARLPCCYSGTDICLKPGHSPAAPAQERAPKEKSHSPWSVLEAPHDCPCPLPGTGRAHRAAEKNYGPPCRDDARLRAPTRRGAPGVLRQHCPGQHTAEVVGGKPAMCGTEVRSRSPGVRRLESLSLLEEAGRPRPLGHRRVHPAPPASLSLRGENSNSIAPGGARGRQRAEGTKRTTEEGSAAFRPRPPPSLQGTVLS